MAREIFGFSLEDLKKAIAETEPVIKGEILLEKDKVLLLKRRCGLTAGSAFDIWKIFSINPALVEVGSNIMKYLEEDWMIHPFLAILEGEDGLSSGRVQDKIEIKKAYRKIMSAGAGSSGGWPDYVMAVWKLS